MATSETTATTLSLSTARDISDLAFEARQGIDLVTCLTDPAHDHPDDAKRCELVFWAADRLKRDLDKLEVLTDPLASAHVTAPAKPKEPEPSILAVLGDLLERVVKLQLEQHDQIAELLKSQGVDLSVKAEPVQ